MPTDEPNAIRNRGHSVLGVVHVIPMAADLDSAVADANIEVERHQPPALILQPDSAMTGDDLVIVAERLGALHPGYGWTIRIGQDRPDLLGERWSPH